MKVSEALDLIKDSLAGRVVDIEVDDTMIKGFLTRGLEVVRPWYEEEALLETVLIKGGDSFKYILKEDLSRLVHVVHQAYPTDPTYVSTHMAEARLMGLSGYKEFSGLQSVEHEMMQRWLGSHLANIYSVHPYHRELEDRILLEGSSIRVGGYVTLKYSPLPAKISEVRKDSALELILEYAIARTKVSLGRARSKFEGSDLEFSTDGRDLISEGNQFLDMLKEKLRDLHFVMSVQKT